MPSYNNHHPIGIQELSETKQVNLRKFWGGAILQVSSDGRPTVSDLENPAINNNQLNNCMFNCMLVKLLTKP